MKNKIIKIMLVFFAVISLAIGLSYAFFNYRKDGSENEIIVGNIYLHYNTSKTLPLVDVEPRSNLDEDMYIEFTVDGLNEHKDNDLWYAIDLLYGDVPSNKTESNRIRDDLLRFTLKKKINEGDYESVIDNNGYSSIDELRMYVETIPKDTTEELSHTYRLYVWVSDEIRVGNNQSDYSIEEWNNLFGSVKVRVLGDFIEKRNDANIKVIFDADGGSVEIPYKYYNDGDTYGNLPIPIKGAYIFLGWEDIRNNIIVQPTDIVNGNTDVEPIEKETKKINLYRYIGNKSYNGTSDYTDTGIKLFSEDNWQRNFYMEFEIKENNSTVSQATLMNAKYEGNNNYPGFTFRRSGSALSYNISANVNSSNKKSGENMSSFSELKKVKFLRIDKKLYYSFNDNDFIFWLDYKNFKLYFETPVTFGASLNGSGTPQRYFKGILSNMLVEFIDDEATLANYKEYISGFPGNYSPGDIILKAKWKVHTMDAFPEFITSKKERIKKIIFRKENESDLARYNAISDTDLKGDIGTLGSVKAWLEIDNIDNLYTLYVESDGKTYLTTGQNLFNGYTNISEIDLSNVNTSKVKNMANMFRKCTKLTNLDLSDFNTSSVTTMESIFQDCSGLKSVNVSSFDTSNVIQINSMFNGCSSLISVDLSSFNTSNVITMRNMFVGCKSLVSVDLSSFNTSKVQEMHNMFSGCKSIITIYVSNLWDTLQVTNSNLMFEGCLSIIGTAPNTSYPYNSSKTNATMAVIATDITEGYLTDISLKPNT